MGHKNASAEEILAACETILNSHTNTQEPCVPPETAAIAGREASHRSDATMTPELDFNAEEANSCSTSEEDDDDVREEELAVQTELVERQTHEPRWSVRVVWPRLPGLGLAMISRWLAGTWNKARAQLVSRRSKKRLRVCDTVSLGEKRFVALIDVDGEQFLVGGASGSVATLARLEASQEFSEVLKRRWSRDSVQA